jgi:glycosyltransferase involved in cell wall biosynthesis
VYDLVRHLLARDVRITLITPPSRNGRPVDPGADALLSNPHVARLTVPYRTFPFAGRKGTTIIDRSTAYPLFGLRAGRAAARFADSGAIDLVHGLGASALGYHARAPLVFNPQGLEEFGATDPTRARLKRVGYAPLRWAVRRCARVANRVIATDRVLVEPLIQHLGVPRANVRVIPNAVDVVDCDRRVDLLAAGECRRQIGLDSDDVLLLSVGRLETNKGFDVLLSALHGLARDGLLATRTWRWVLIGDGPMATSLRREIVSRGLHANVVTPGRVPDDQLHAWYEAATCFVHPTLYEGSSLVTLEAMAHRRPVVASRAGGLPDKVIPGVNGWLVEPGDQRALAAAIELALSDPARLQQMGIESRAIVESEFSWPSVVTRLLELYAELLEDQPSSL